MDIFYPEWKMKIAANEKLFRMTCQLWREAYCHSGEGLEDMTRKRSDHGGDGPVGGANDGADVENETECLSFKWHPFGAFDCDRGYMVSAKSSLNLTEAQCFVPGAEK